MATLKDVAELAGVTVTTISRMLNNRANVSDKTRARIEAAMAQLDYQPNEIAQSLIKNKTNMIGLIVPSARNFFFATIIDRVEYYVCQNGYKLLLCVSDLDLKKEVEYFNMLKSNKVAGVILASHTQNLLEHVSFQAPIITIDRTISQEIPSVCADNYSGGRLAAEHLLTKGCRRLAYISGSADIAMDANKRFIGFRDVCLERGAKPPLMIDASERSFISMQYRPLIQEMFSANPDIDGVFSSNDIIAAQLLQYCSESGIRVPEQLKVVGYDDVDIASLITPRLTTIRQPVDEICRHAVHSIISASNGETIPSSVTFPVKLVERGTT